MFNVNRMTIDRFDYRFRENGFTHYFLLCKDFTKIIFSPSIMFSMTELSRVLIAAVAGAGAGLFTYIFLPKKY